MTANEIKEYICDNNLVEDVLLELGCHHIKKHSNYWTCGNVDGDNTSAIVVYDNENLTVVNYTRQMTKQIRTTDIFDLIAFVKDCSFSESLKWVCGLFGLDYYAESEEMPMSLQIIQLVQSMNTDYKTSKEIPLKPISAHVLDGYLPYGNVMWLHEGISLRTQADFNIMFDPQTNYIVIPIYDAIGNLVGCKGRYYGQPDEHNCKYIYLEKCNKSRVLYGLWQNREFIKNSRILYLVESEKSVLKLYEYGVRNAVATGGKNISQAQIEMIVRTGCTPILALDQDVKYEEIEMIKQKFPESMSVMCMYDTDHILDVKESPADNKNKWNALEQGIMEVW